MRGTTEGRAIGWPTLIRLLLGTKQPVVVPVTMATTTRVQWMLDKADNVRFMLRRYRHQKGD